MTTFHIANHSDAILSAEVGHLITKSSPTLPRRCVQQIASRPKPPDQIPSPWELKAVSKAPSVLGACKRTYQDWSSVLSQPLYGHLFQKTGAKAKPKTETLRQMSCT